MDDALLFIVIMVAVIFAVMRRTAGGA